MKLLEWPYLAFAKKSLMKYEAPEARIIITRIMKIQTNN